MTGLRTKSPVNRLIRQESSSHAHSARTYYSPSGHFAPLFSRRVFALAQVLLIGSILTPGRRTVYAALRVMGREQTPHFQNYPRVLSRAQWSPRQAARILLCLLVAAFVPEGTILIGDDETFERRQ